MLHRLAVRVAFVGVLMLSVGGVRADVFNMGGTRDPATGVWTGQASLEFVTVGGPGNAPDTMVMNDGTTGYGSVPYVYRMGRYDVTVGQYCQFLNAVAASDTYGLYNSQMETYPTIGITQSGSPGSYTYSVSYNAIAWSSYVTYNPSLYPSALAAANDCPTYCETWGDAARFCNWLSNGQPSFLPGSPGEVAGSTETGAYTLDGATSDSALVAVTRNAGATYFIPTLDEWYKAAYYKGGGTAAGYWSYPTRSDAPPVNVLSATGTNNANCFDLYATGNSGYSDAVYSLTPVGAFASTVGPYGTYDMGGDLEQWNETNVGYLTRGKRGGFWDYTSNLMLSWMGGDDYPSDESPYNGFRVGNGVLTFFPGFDELLIPVAKCGCKEIQGQS